MARSLTYTSSYNLYHGQVRNYGTTRNKNASINANKYVQISIEDVQRKHNERNITYFENDDPNNFYDISSQTRVAYKSIRRAKSLHKRDRERIVVPRRHFHAIDRIVSSFYDPVPSDDCVMAFPLVEDMHFTYVCPPFSDGDQTQNQDIRETYLQNNDFQQDVQDSSFVNPTRDFQEYSDRKRTFEGYNEIGKPTSENLCKAGFFYSGYTDRVVCFTCGLGLKDLDADNNPLVEHVRHSDRCTFLLERLGEEKLTKLKTFLCQSDPEYNRKCQCKETHRREVHAPNYENIQDRVSSYTRWPLQEHVAAVAETGLYYSGYETDIRCFACDGGFRNMNSVDDLWIDHCFYFPTCSYMETKVGQHFINKIKEIACGYDNQEDALNEQSGVTFREISADNQRSLKEHCLDMGFIEKDIDAALTELAFKGYSHNIGPLLDLLNLYN